jgi:8-oxo-dGTP diphosphatase
MKTISVVAAIIQHAGKILAVQRGPAKYSYISEKWEFPGGKVEPHETPEEALVREIQEELYLNIAIEEYLMTVEHTYPDFHLSMQCFLCTSASDQVTLTEHLAHRWLDANNLEALDWAAADVPIVIKLQQG